MIKEKLISDHQLTRNAIIMVSIPKAKYLYSEGIGAVEAMDW